MAKPYINLIQVNLGLPGGQICLLFQIKSTGGKGAEISSAEWWLLVPNSHTPVTTVLVKSHLELYTCGVTIYHQYVHKTGHITSREMPVLKYTG